MSNRLDKQIEAALHEVCDPCSLAANAPLSIVDMGLVKGWSIDREGHVSVRMCLTSPLCTMVPHMVRGVEEVLIKIDGIASASVDVDPTIQWLPSDMTQQGKEQLEHRRQESMQRSPVRPQQWRERSGSSAAFG